MSERRAYARSREIELPPLSGGGMHYAELRFNPVHGTVTEFCIGYKVWCKGEYAEIVRYDGDHGSLHRHREGYPEPGEIMERFTEPRVNQYGRVAIDHIKANCEAWQHVLPTETKDEARLAVEARKEEPT